MQENKKIENMFWGENNGKVPLKTKGFLYCFFWFIFRVGAYHQKTIWYQWVVQ